MRWKTIISNKRTRSVKETASLAYQIYRCGIIYYAIFCGKVPKESRRQRKSRPGKSG